jgi:hypothetical protein
MSTENLCASGFEAPKSCALQLKYVIIKVCQLFVTLLGNRPVFHESHVGLNGRVVWKTVVVGLVGHAESVRRDLNDVPGGVRDVTDDPDPEEGVDAVLRVKLPQDAVAVPRVQVERAQNLPAAQSIDYFLKQIQPTAMLTEFRLERILSSLNSVNIAEHFLPTMTQTQVNKSSTLKMYLYFNFKYTLYNVYV